MLILERLDVLFFQMVHFRFIPLNTNKLVNQIANNSIQQSSVNLKQHHLSSAITHTINFEQL
jgi:hypothetical protein